MTPKPPECPKCGYEHMSGPWYRDLMFIGERLAYRCSRCGYGLTTPTLDNQPTAQPTAILTERENKP